MVPKPSIKVLTDGLCSQLLTLVDAKTKSKPLLFHWHPVKMASLRKGVRAESKHNCFVYYVYLMLIRGFLDMESLFGFRLYLIK